MAKLEGCANCAKILLIVFNIVFFIVGIALLAVGIWVVTSPYNLDILSILDNPILESGAYFIIALGAFIFVVSFLGCCGAWMENRLMLIIYFIIVLLIFIAQLIGCAVIIAYKDKVDAFVTNQLRKTMNNYEGEAAENKYSQGWNALQVLLECCGTNNYTDWMDTPWYGNNTNIMVGGQSLKPEWPATCCKVDNNLVVFEGKYPTPNNLTYCYGVGVNEMTRDMYLNTEGCYQAFEDWVKSRALYIGGVGLGLAFLEIMGMVLSMCLVIIFKKQ
ncbi:tetraspanin-1-like isoform X2 [Acanthaster planci]|uniref:Tetraspanin n=1 Tax=Acanthaster planci TaxID=133434 RepID=A0A8B7XTK7_ACAPL|nr:tetraspanin-1-like isoform X2 [Acanthaster planci]